MIASCDQSSVNKWPMSRYAAKRLGEQIRAARLARGLSPTNAARVLEIERQTLYNYESGRWFPKVEFLAAAARAWGVTFELDGCAVVPQEKPKLEPTKREEQLELFRSRAPQVYKRATVRIRRKGKELVITATARIA
jgi:transcriptional regulator with XRE-family HTH domain